MIFSILKYVFIVYISMFTFTSIVMLILNRKSLNLKEKVGMVIAQTYQWPASLLTIISFLIVAIYCSFNKDKM